MGRDDRLEHSHPRGKSATGLGARPGLHRLPPLPQGEPSRVAGKVRGAPPAGTPQKGAHNPKRSAHTNAHTRKAPGPRADTVTPGNDLGAQSTQLPSPAGRGLAAPKGAPRPECTPRGRRRPRRGEPGAAYPVGGLAAEARNASMESAGEAGRGRRSGPASQALAVAAAALIHFFRADPSSSVAGRRRTAARPERQKGLEQTQAGGGAGPRGGADAGRGCREQGAPRPREHRPRCRAPPERPALPAARLRGGGRAPAGPEKIPASPPPASPGLCSREGGH